MSDQTLYNWRAKFGGMEVNEARRLRELEEENRRLKTMVADLSLDKEALKTVIRKNRLELVGARRDVALLMREHLFSERQACRLLDLDRSSYRYERRPDRNAALRPALLQLAREKPRYGHRRLWAILRAREPKLSLARVYRLYRSEHLAMRRTMRKRVVRSAPLNAELTAANQEWAMTSSTTRSKAGEGSAL